MNYTLREIAEILKLQSDFLDELAREDIIAPDVGDPASTDPHYSERMLERARVAYELVHELDVNLAGASVIVRLREEMVWLCDRVGRLALEVERSRARKS
jgi:hypothetical protein